MHKSAASVQIANWIKLSLDGINDDIARWPCPVISCVWYGYHIRASPYGYLGYTESSTVLLLCMKGYSTSVNSKNAAEVTHNLPQLVRNILVHLLIPDKHLPSWDDIFYVDGLAERTKRCQHLASICGDGQYLIDVVFFYMARLSNVSPIWSR